MKRFGAAVIIGVVASVAGAGWGEAHAAKPWKGFVIGSEDGAHELRIGAQLNVDARGFPGDEADAYTDEVRIRRMRMNLRAKVFEHFSMRMLFDTADSRLQILDAVIEVRLMDELKLRIGKEKSPVSYERLQSSSTMHFLESGAAAALTNNRDIGLQLVGVLGDGLLDYQLGVWDGGPDSVSIDQNDGDGFDLAGRVSFQPFREAGLRALEGLVIGVGGSWGEVEGELDAPLLGSYRSSGRATWYRTVSGDDLATTVIADGTRMRLGGHLYWRFGPVSLFGEVVQSLQDVRLGEEAATLGNVGWVAQATWLVTCEDASWTGVKPREPFDPQDGGTGAVELAVRWSELTIDEEAFEGGFADVTRSARGARSFTAGVTWTLNPNVRLQLNWERTMFDGGAGEGDRPTEDLVGTRVQLLL